MVKNSPSLGEIAKRISAHLKRFEKDPKINRRQEFIDGKWQDSPEGSLRGVGSFYYANASAAGRYVNVLYITYQGQSSLIKTEALAYLEWLDAGNVGTHLTFRHATEKTGKKARKR